MSHATFDFKAAGHVAAFTCTHVMSGGAPILYVSHDRDGDWQFLCGAEQSSEAFKRQQPLLP